MILNYRFDANKNFGFSELYAALRVLFGESTTMYDEYKCSFGFPFHVTVNKNNEKFEYIFNFTDIKGGITFLFRKLLLTENEIEQYKTINLLREPIEKEFSEVILLKEEGNLWWAEATNIGVKYAIQLGATYVMTLNNDTLPEPDYIERMLYWSNKEPEALLGALAVDVNNGTMLYGGEKREWSTGKGIQLLDTIPKDKKIALIDDSIVRGTTSRRIIETIRSLGAKKIDFFSTCPKIQHPCFYGIDFPTSEELIGYERTEEEIAKIIGADSVIYQSIDNLVKAIGLKKEELCMACLTGNYPTNITKEDIIRLGEERRKERK